jgi:hypothetical protein
MSTLIAEKENVIETMEKFSLKVSLSVSTKFVLEHKKRIKNFPAKNFLTSTNYFLIIIFRSQSPRKALNDKELNVLPVKQPKLKGMDDVSHPEQKKAEEIGAIAHKTASYPFDPALEPLLQDNPRRFVIFPIEYEDIWKMYKKVNI